VIERKLKIKAPIDIVFAVVRNFEAYPEFLETTLSAKERKGESGIEVDFEVEVVKKIRYTLAIEEKAPDKVSWSLVSGELMKSNSGAWVLKSLDSETTEARYQIDIGFGWLVPKAIIEQVTKSQLPETLKAFKERAENLFHKHEKKAQKI